MGCRRDRACAVCWLKRDKYLRISNAEIGGLDVLDVRRRDQVYRYSRLELKVLFYFIPYKHIADVECPYMEVRDTMMLLKLRLHDTRETLEG